MPAELLPFGRTRRRPAPRAGVLVALLALTVALAGTLAYEAYQAARSQRATAERALRDYAHFAAYEILAGARDSVRDALTAALSPVTGVRALSPFEALPPPALLARTAAGALGCAAPADDSARFYFRLDLRDGALATSGAAVPAALARWVADTVARHVRVAYKPDWRAATIFGPVVLVYGVKYAEFGAPIAAFGFSTCASAFGVPLFRTAVARQARSPASAALGAPGVAADSLLAVTVLDAAGRVVFRSAPGPATSHASEVTLETLGGLRARVALRDAALARLPVPPAGTRLPVLLGLLLLTAALAAIAVLQLRRESELARLRSDFTSSVSHELRTPLAQIVLFAETLALGRVRSEREGREAAGVVLQEARRLMHLVENVLFFSRAEHRANHPAPRPVDVRAALDEIAGAFAVLAAERGARLTVDVAGAPAALADPGALRQMVLNLLDNAAKYGPPGQTITLGAGAWGARVRVWVEDEGPGIPARERERVWLPFLRLQRDRNGASGGSGIGLAVVRELAQLHGGAAWIEAGRRGGALVIVELPGAGDGAAPAVAPPVDAFLRQAAGARAPTDANAAAPQTASPDRLHASSANGSHSLRGGSEEH
jgi:signal transduction histidine kinase